MCGQSQKYSGEVNQTKPKINSNVVWLDFTSPEYFCDCLHIQSRPHKTLHFSKMIASFCHQNLLHFLESKLPIFYQILGKYKATLWSDFHPVLQYTITSYLLSGGCFMFAIYSLFCGSHIDPQQCPHTPIHACAEGWEVLIAAAERI